MTGTNRLCHFVFPDLRCLNLESVLNLVRIDGMSSVLSRPYGLPCILHLKLRIKVWPFTSLPYLGVNRPILNSRESGFCINRRICINSQQRSARLSNMECLPSDVVGTTSLPTQDQRSCEGTLRSRPLGSGCALSPTSLPTGDSTHHHEGLQSHGRNRVA